MKNSSIVRVALVVTFIVGLSACGNGKKSIAMKLHSDPQGAYALMQVKQNNSDQADWIFLGPTPVVTNQKVALKGASTVSLKVIRPGFYEQTKTWSMKDFLREYRDSKEIVWIPNMVKQ